jgi:N-formylglutamate amidohydrolase
VLAGEIERVLARHGLCDPARRPLDHARGPAIFRGSAADSRIWGRSTARAARRNSITLRRSTLARATAFSSVVNGRFKGGFITRYYGAPARGIPRAAARDGAGVLHERVAAVSLGFATRARPLVAVLKSLVEVLVSTRPRR